ncbi:ABC transporter ATP-binding protein [Streptomyces sp. NPDC051453]|uniref:ABC transporter ATP-binding protein n=1 Tax=Streptomyces sp. NPDC051453 TaxID=3154941 RepID=UPI0034249DDA
MPAVVANNLSRIYRSSSGGFFRKKTKDFEALRGVDLEIPQGSLFGLLGPNGAGKTTTVRILTTLLVPTGGSVTIQGIDAVAEPHRVRERIGYALGGDKGFYERLSARDNLRFFADLYRVAARDQHKRVDHVLELVNLDDRRDDRVEGYSRGMKQRLHIARSLLHDPDIIFLDEPTNGLDPLAARDIRQAVKQLRTAGKTILLTTHYMFEAEELCDRLAVINHGKIITEGTSRDLADAAQTGLVARVECRGATEAVCERLQAAAGVISASLESLDDRELVTVRLSVSSSAKAEQLVTQALDEMTDVQVLHLSLREPTLEDSYIALVSQADGGGRS